MRNKYTCNTCTLFDRAKNEWTQTPDSQCDIRSICPDDGSSIDPRSHRAEHIPSYPTGDETDEPKQEVKTERPTSPCESKTETKKPLRHRTTKRKRRKKSKTKRRVSRQDNKKPKRSRAVGKLSKRSNKTVVKKKRIPKK